MAKKPKTVRFMLRLPADLHARLLKSAKSAAVPRSLNSEIIYRLLDDLAEYEKAIEGFSKLTSSERETVSKNLSEAFWRWLEKTGGEK